MHTFNRFQRGVTIFELITTMLIGSSLLGTALCNFKKSEDTAGYAANEMIGYLKKIRAKALVSTRSYIISPQGSFKVIAHYGTSCTDVNPVLDPSLQMTLPSQSHFTATDWSVCFTPRGLTNNSLDVTIIAREQTKTVNISLGGSVRVL